jgi:hypothetical protein
MWLRAAAAALPTLAACGDGGDDGGPAAAGTNYSGLYRGTVVNAPGGCAPTPLPAPLLADSTRYLAAGFLAPGASRGANRVAHAGTQLRVTPTDTAGNDPGPPFVGTIADDGSFLVDRSVALGAEGPREGGRTFFVEQAATVQGRFTTAAGAMRHTAAGNIAYRFRDGGPTGAIVVTCSYAFTADFARVGS